MIVELNRKQGEINAKVTLPGDKSIAHRSLIIGSLGEGKYTIDNFPNSQDCLSTLDCTKRLGVDIVTEGSRLMVESPGYTNFKKVTGTLEAGNSGTTARLLSGLLAGAGLDAAIDGDFSLRKRPMDRIMTPLLRMGAVIDSSNNLLPLEFHAENKLKGIEYVMPVASAQVKSCILIAGFLAEGITVVIERKSTRDHTERMFKALGADLTIQGNKVSIRNGGLRVKDMKLPGDVSSAAFLIGCALLQENCTLTIEGVLLNERRIKFLDILKKMGANINYKATDIVNFEEVGYIEVSTSILKGITIQEEEVPNIIDEIPILAVVSSFAEGKTTFKGISELKHKESNRILAIASNLRSCGVDVSFTEDMLEIEGGKTYLDEPIEIDPSMDHRIALAFAAVSCRNNKAVTIKNWECTEISFPDATGYLQEFFHIQTHM